MEVEEREGGMARLNNNHNQNKLFVKAGRSQTKPDRKHNAQEFKTNHYQTQEIVKCIILVYYVEI